MATTQKQAAVTSSLTEQAAAEIKKVMAAEKVDVATAGLRVAVMPGGCSGFRYSLNVEDRPEAEDVVVESQGVRLFVDGFSAPDLNGTRVDYKSTFQESGFAFESPNAAGGCGRGRSFTVGLHPVRET